MEETSEVLERRCDIGRTNGRRRPHEMKLEMEQKLYQQNCTSI